MLQLERNEIQGIILSGYGHASFNASLFLQFGSARGVKNWLAKISDSITSASPLIKDSDKTDTRPPLCINIAFTWQGLDKLGVKLDGFSTEFKEGITGIPSPHNHEKVSNRSQRLGDTASSDPALWEVGGPDNEIVDAMLMLFAPDLNSLNTLQDQNKSLLAEGDIKVVMVQESYRPKHEHEPFGFLDGLSQPHIEGNIKTDIRDNQPVIKAGEFVLGYKNEYGLYPPQPDVPQLSRNGSYLVFRKLQQDVVGFWNYIYQIANGDPLKAEFIGAKMVGRWRSGAPMILAPDEDDPTLATKHGKSNNFMFTDNDRLGYGCPIASHIRRTNPRDSLLPDPQSSLLTVTKHRILRRGRVYGPKYNEDVVNNLPRLDTPTDSTFFKPSEDDPRGLALLLINADIKRQFEFIQQTWVNDPKFDGLFDDRDPIVGNNGEDKDIIYNMTIGRRPIRKQLQKVPRFVTVKGGSYMFLPSISGLKWLSR